MRRKRRAELGPGRNWAYTMGGVFYEIGRENADGVCPRIMSLRSSPAGSIAKVSDGLGIVPKAFIAVAESHKGY